jgi:glycosyltransferase involved in cell wall biosynthesis
VKTEPVISIVTPSRDQGKFLAETVQSVLSQEGNFFLDYVIMDGASTDNSVEVIRQFERRVAAGEFVGKCRGISYRWQSAVDRGQADALAKGFRLATGDIFSWLNSDDFLLPGAVASASSFFEKNPSTAMLYGNAYYCDQTGDVLGNYPTEPFSISRLASFNFIPQPATFFRKSSYDAAGGINSDLKYAMDHDLWVRIGRQFPCSHLPQFLANYRLHAEAKTMLDKTLHDSHEEALTVVMKHFGWAPLNMLYGACYYQCRMKLPNTLKMNRLLLIPLSVICTAIRSICLNKGVDHRDFQLFTTANFRKLLKDRKTILLGKVDGR